MVRCHQCCTLPSVIKKLKTRAKREQLAGLEVYLALIGDICTLIEDGFLVTPCPFPGHIELIDKVFQSLMDLSEALMHKDARSIDELFMKQVCALRQNQDNRYLWLFFNFRNHLSQLVNWFKELPRAHPWVKQHQPLVGRLRRYVFNE